MLSVNSDTDDHVTWMLSVCLSVRPSVE